MSSRLSKSSEGHIGFVGRQPRQCRCLICGSPMTDPETCPLTADDRVHFLTFVSRNRTWRSLASSIRQSGNPSTPQEEAVYRVVNSLGPSKLKAMKLTGDIADQILDGIRKSV